MQRQPRTHDISWFLDLNKNKQLDLDPPYQRRSVWTRKDREFFIDTIFKNYPSPAVFLHKTMDDNGRSTYHVVDGKQRLQTILMFSDNKLRIPANFGDTKLNGKRWSDLSADDRQRFWNYEVLVEFLPTTENAVITNVFERVNRNSRKLTAQELRHAKYDGWFMDFIEEQSADPEWADIGVVTKARAKRMSDAQFLSELLAVVIDKKIHGFDQDLLDKFAANYDDPSEEEPPIDTDEVSERFLDLRKSLLAMVSSYPKLKPFMKTNMHMYSLWAHLNTYSEMPNLDKLANTYLTFMDRVEFFDSNPDAPSSTDEPAKSVDIAAKKYAENSSGATTEEPLRQARGEALADGFNALK